MNEKLINKKIAVLYGGTSGEREVSLRSGKKVFDSIISQGLNAVLIDTKEDFIPKLKEEKPDIACIVLHGRGGEDGTIQGLLEILGIPYTGSKVLASALAMDKVASKRIWEACGISTPKYSFIDPDKDIDQECERIKRAFPFPLVVKPSCEGSSLGVSILKDDKEFLATVKEAYGKYGDIFVEEFIDGRQVTVGILGQGVSAQALPVLELKPKSEFYDYESKYTPGGTEFILPAPLPKLVYSNVVKTAVDAHNSLGCRGFSRVDIIIDRDGTAFVHDVNTIPGMTDLSDLPAQAKAGGLSYDDLVLRILESALI
jgi:D-alanine-D-alanine ligase